MAVPRPRTQIHPVMPPHQTLSPPVETGRRGDSQKRKFLDARVTSAGLDDGQAAPQLLALISAAAFPRLETIFGDNKYHNYDLYAWMAIHRPTWRLEIKTRPEGSSGFTPLRQRWLVERTNAWSGRGRRNSKDYERKPASSAAMVQLSHINLMLNRLSPRPGPACHYRQKAA